MAKKLLTLGRCGAVLLALLFPVAASADFTIQDGDHYDRLNVEGDVLITGGSVDELVCSVFKDGTLQMTDGLVHSMRVPMGGTVIEGGQIGPSLNSTYPVVIEGGTLDVKGGSWNGGIYRTDRDTAVGTSTIVFRGRYFRYWSNENPNEEYAAYRVEGWLLDGTFASIRVTNGVTDMSARWLPIDFVIDPNAPIGGDVNGDWEVTLDDLNIVRNHFGEPGAHADGDLDGSGLIDLADLNLVRNSFGSQFTAGGKEVLVSGRMPGTGQSTSVPEPSTLGLSSMIAPALFSAWKRRSSTRD